jgi:phosphoglycerate dehydrogenase-like enzyme
MTKVAVLDDWQDAARPSADWSPLEAKAEVVFFRDTLHEEDALVHRLKDFDILLTMRERTRFPASVIARLPKLRMFNITGARNPSVDVPALLAQGVTVCRTESGESGEATAELALCLMLSAARRVPAGDAGVRAGTFQQGIPPGVTMRGKTLGVIGLGRLGSAMAGYGKALGMEVLAWSPNMTEQRAAEKGAVYVSKSDLLKRADVVSLHLVLAPSTRGIISAPDLALMKRGAILVNTSRGPLVDELDLVTALHDGAIVAALDVYNIEPLPADSPLLRTPNTILSPHLGYCVQTNYRTFYEQSVENTLAFLAGSPIRLMPAPT